MPAQPGENALRTVADPRDVPPVPTPQSHKKKEIEMKTTEFHRCVHGLEFCTVDYSFTLSLHAGDDSCIVGCPCQKTPMLCYTI